MRTIAAFAAPVALLLLIAIASFFMAKTIIERGDRKDQLALLGSEIEAQQETRQFLGRAINLQRGKMVAEEALYETTEARLATLTTRRDEAVQLLTSLEFERNQLVIEAEAARKSATRKPASPLPEPQDCPKGKSFTGNVSGYSSTPDQTWGDPFTTATGTTVHWGTIAVDPRHIPYGCRLKIDAFPNTVFVAEDTGGAILGYWNRIDIWFPSRNAALDWGRQYRSVTVV